MIWIRRAVLPLDRLHRGARSTVPRLLLEGLAGEAATRFLVVTHHQLTMAHMDRLYGVTMQEPGVSRVLSVDFARAAEMAE